MRVGILTFHRAKNFGAVLQCYALYQYLHNVGYDVCVIDYRPDYLAGVKDEISFFGRLKTILKSALYWIVNCGETEYGDVFREFIKANLPLAGLEDIGSLDAIVCGSDQIWNSQICRGYDPIFFGMVPKLQKIPVICYAASMGKVDSIPEKEEFLRKLKNYRAISVREQSLSQKLTSCGIYNTIVVDPVILAGCQVFKNVLISIRQKGPYVLVYELTRLQGTYDFARRIASQINAEIVVIGGGAKQCLNLRIHNKQWLSPSQFVSYFSDASCVVTNSFHGLAFSLVYNKPFYCLKTSTWKDDRNISLLSQLGLEGRMVDCGTKLFFDSIDYSKISPKIDEMKEMSYRYLVGNLKK